MLVMRLPKEKIINMVDWILGAGYFSVPGRPDFKEGQKKMRAINGNRLIMDHPERNDRIIGTKDGAASSPVTKTSNR
jgi:hypothetical protein